MGIYSVKPKFQQLLVGAKNLLVRRRVHPDQITVSALVLSLLGGGVVYGSHWFPWLLLIAPPLALGRVALNALDGMVAKASGLARPWGEVLNEFCDRLSDVAFFGGLAIAPFADFRLGAAVLVAILLSSFLGTLSKAAGGPRQYGGIMGKADRMIYLSIASVLAFLLGPWVMNYFLAVVLLGVLVTIYQRWRKTFGDVRVTSGRKPGVHDG